MQRQTVTWVCVASVATMVVGWQLLSRLLCGACRWRSVCRCMHLTCSQWQRQLALGSNHQLDRAARVSDRLRLFPDTGDMDYWVCCREWVPVTVPADIARPQSWQTGGGGGVVQCSEVDGAHLPRRCRWLR